MAIERYTVAAAPAEYPAGPQVVLELTPKEVVVTLDSAVAGQELFVSWDGVTDHAHLTLLTIVGLRFTQHGQRIWLRGVGAPAVQVIAED